MLVLSCARNIAHRSLSHGPVQIRIRVARIQADRLAAIVDGALVVAQPQLRVASRIERQRVRRIDLERLIERLHRLLEILLFGQIAALPVEAVGITARFLVDDAVSTCGGFTLRGAEQLRRLDDWARGLLRLATAGSRGATTGRWLRRGARRWDRRLSR